MKAYLPFNCVDICTDDGKAVVGKTVNQYFSNDKYVRLQNHAGVKDPFKEQRGSLDFNVMI